MIRLTSAVLTGLLVLSPVLYARDLGFRYQSGKCIDGQGQEGLNPSFLGQCSDLRHVVLQNLDLSEIDFSGSLFDFSDLQLTLLGHSNFTGASFASANLAGADLSRALLHQVNFKAATLVNIHFAAADIQDSDFSDSDLSGAILSYMSFQQCSFVGANLSGAALDHTDFSGADLHDLNLTAVDLQGATLNRANLSHTDFSGANLNRTQMSEVNGVGAILRGAILRQAKIERSALAGATFRGAQMDGASLSYSDLSRADLRGAKLSSAQATETTFTGAKFSRSTVLPFGTDEAVQKGMVLVKSAALILWDEKGADLDGLVQYLESQGLTVTVSDQDSTHFDGSQKLFGFTSVLHLLGSTRVMMRNVPANGQDALLGFVQRGGTYVATQWLGYMSTHDHLLRRMQDLILLGTNSAATGGAQFNAVSTKTDHPVLSGVPSSFALPGGVAVSQLSTFDRQPAVSLMQDEDGKDLVAAREYGLGKVVNFSFAGAVNLDNADTHLLALPIVRQLVLNSLEW